MSVNCFATEPNLDELVQTYQEFFKQHHWQDLIQGYEAEACGCGDVYRQPNYLNRPNEDVAIADMRHLKYSEPHYHPAGNFEIYFVMQGTALVVVGDQQYQVKSGNAIVIPPLKAHYVIPDNQFIIAVVNTPPFRIENYIPLVEANPIVEFDLDRFKKLI